ncbi:secretion protein HlyD [uncultured Rothia sp.]|uniref:secretion protein HlyD n=1 Tax=uncultured Rothia sp. TaxID=316088 RepID=UPI0028F0692A|nr:secretion protein HlyD [uncultured Rothia sp.]
MSATPTRQKKTLWLYGIIALLLIITVGTLISAQNIKTTAQKDAEAAPPDPSTITATVTREKLRTTVPLTCTANYATSTPLRYSGEGQYTAITIKHGDTVGNGTLIAEVNGEPLITLTGGFALYRDLKLDDSGPDAALLNEALTAMGRQGPQPARITEDTYEALNNLLDSLGYAPLKTDQPIPARYFLIINRAGLVTGNPRATGAIADGPVATIAEGSKTLSCTGTTGRLTPEARSGQKVTVPSLGDTEYVATLGYKNTSETAGNSQAGRSTQPNGAEGAAGSNLNGAGAAGSAEGERILTLDVGDKADSLRGAVNAELTLEETPEAHLVVPSSALYTRDGQTRVIVLGPESSNGSKAREEREVTVTIISNANGKNAVTGDLHEGDSVKIMREKK